MFTVPTHFAFADGFRGNIVAHFTSALRRHWHTGTLSLHRRSKRIWLVTLCLCSSVLFIRNIRESQWFAACSRAEETSSLFLSLSHYCYCYYTSSRSSGSGSSSGRTDGRWHHHQEVDQNRLVWHHISIYRGLFGGGGGCFSASGAVSSDLHQ